jgi:hypothetical protein
MGKDIHGVFQKNEAGCWADIPSEYNEDRDYYLYDWLALRREFALSQPRGFPDDFEIDENGFHPIASRDILPPDLRKHCDLLRGMGEWGFSWLLGAEIVNAHKPVRQMKIWIPIDAYNEWDKVSNPKHWHELHSDWQQHEDSEYYATPENIREGTWRVIIDWIYDFTDDFKYFVDEVRRLMVLHGDVRFVFGFNS